MKKFYFMVLVLIFISGCFQPSLRSIVKNPDKAVKECNKYENVDEVRGCLMKFAKGM